MFVNLRDSKDNIVIPDPIDIFSLQKEINVHLTINDFVYWTSDTDSSYLSEFISKNGLPLFFFRFTKNDCSSCIREMMLKINQLPIWNNDQKILILGEFLDKTEYNQFKHFFIKNNNIILFNVQRNNLKIPAESSQLPYLFQIDSSNKISSFHLININDLTPVDEYMSIYMNLDVRYIPN